MHTMYKEGEGLDLIELDRIKRHAFQMYTSLWRFCDSGSITYYTNVTTYLLSVLS